MPRKKTTIAVHESCVHSRFGFPWFDVPAATEIVMFVGAAVVAITKNPQAGRSSKAAKDKRTFFDELRAVELNKCCRGQPRRRPWTYSSPFYNWW